MARTAGIHHVTALASEPGPNVAFYTRALGLRLVKRTVNHDAPGVHHLYYADAVGSPGTTLTFFPYPRARGGRAGLGQASAVGFRVPPDSVEYWTARLRSEGAESVTDAGERFGDTVVRFRDPDGLPLELVASAGAEAADDGVRPWEDSPVPPERAIRGFEGVTLTVPAEEATHRVLSEVLGLRREREGGGRARYRAAGGPPGDRLDLVADPDASPGRASAGTVHHVAWRAADEEEQEEFREAAVALGLDPTPVVDRYYFRSVYFREPGGVLFEVATDGPGFTRDESVEELGSGLVLPPWLEERREEIERELPALD